MSGTVLGAGDIRMNKVGMAQPTKNLWVIGEEIFKMIKKYRIKKRNSMKGVARG